MRSQILVPLISLAVAAQVCCCCTMLGGPQPPYAIAPSDAAVQRFEERMNSVDTGANNSFTITITEEEMTSLVVRQMSKQENPPPISEPQVHFRNGRVEFYATVQFAESLALPGLVAFSITAVGGKVEVSVEEIALGPLPIPQSMLESLTDMINQTLTQNIQVDGAEAIITEVQIADGEMRISGEPASD